MKTLDELATKFRLWRCYYATLTYSNRIPLNNIMFSSVSSNFTLEDDEKLIKRIYKKYFEIPNG
jgi:hypothetical protein